MQLFIAMVVIQGREPNVVCGLACARHVSCAWKWLSQIPQKQIDEMDVGRTSISSITKSILNIGGQESKAMHFGPEGETVQFLVYV